MGYIEKLMRKKFGTFGEGKYIFARCHLCRKLLATKDFLGKSGCPKCGGKKFSPTNITFIEQMWMIIRLVIG